MVIIEAGKHQSRDLGGLTFSPSFASTRSVYQIMFLTGKFDFLDFTRIKFPIKKVVIGIFLHQNCAHILALDFNSGLNGYSVH